MIVMRNILISPTKNITIPRSKHPQDKDKSESQISLDHDSYCIEHNILVFNTKVKGEPQWNKSKSKYVQKKSENAGFFDKIFLFNESICFFLELKAGKGGIWKGHQIDQYEKVIKKGGFALCSNSVRDTHQYLLSKGLVK